MRKSATPFVVAAAAQADKTAVSLKELLNELTDVAKGIAADELARAKRDIALNVPKMFEATGRISSRLQALETLLVYGRPDDYYATYMLAIQASALPTSNVWRVLLLALPSHDGGRRRSENTIGLLRALTSDRSKR